MKLTVHRINTLTRSRLLLKRFSTIPVPLHFADHLQRSFHTSRLLLRPKDSWAPTALDTPSNAAVTVDGKRIKDEGQPVATRRSGTSGSGGSDREMAQEEANEKVLEFGPDGEARGRLSPTNSHLLRLTLPLPNAKNPVAFVLHPSQPLSHLARLIAAEMPAKPVTHVEFTGFGRVEGQLRWSDATDIGDFVMQAARVRKFGITLKSIKSEDGQEGVEKQLEVVVPSFTERTRYFVARLSKVNAALKELGDKKERCDAEARAGARRMAAAGLGGLVAYWGIVARLTFWDLGWDIMEPVTYLTGNAVLVSGYCYWLYHQRRPDYDALLDQSVSSRQAKLYQSHGFDIERHRSLTAEGRTLRNEIRKIADEYGIDWDENLKTQGAAVRQNIELEERSKRAGKSKEEDDGKDSDEVDEEKEQRIEGMKRDAN
ncbi:hypothetical protein P7C70_g5097, partial [Phenoliferia sp. Uapishka_3]